MVRFAVTLLSLTLADKLSKCHRLVDGKGFVAMRGKGRMEPGKRVSSSIYGIR